MGPEIAKTGPTEIFVAFSIGESYDFLRVSGEQRKSFGQKSDRNMQFEYVTQELMNYSGFYRGGRTTRDRNNLNQPSTECL